MKSQSRMSYLRAGVPIKGPLLRYLDPGAPLVVFDVGACEGEDSIRYARLLPAARIIAIEPVPDNQARCAALIAREHLTDRIALERCALGAGCGSATLFVSSGQPPDAAGDWDYGNKSSSLYPPGEVRNARDWLQFNQTIEVPVRTLAAVANDHAVARIDLLHLDVQGAELEVLRGAGAWLQRIGLIWLEVAAIPLYAGQPLRHDIEAFMAAANFVCVHETRRSRDGDQLYRHRELRKRPLWQRLVSRPARLRRV